MNDWVNVTRNDLSTEKKETTGDRSCRYVVVSQVKSNRVVYYTDDPDYQPPTNADWYYVSIYDGVLPAGMSLRNCWGWRFNGHGFVDAREAKTPSPEESLLANNKKSLLKILNEKIDAVRNPFMPSCAHGDLARRAKLKEARQYLARPDGIVDKEARFKLLEAVAVARNCSLTEAARLVVARAEEYEQVIVESERFREQMSQAIDAAKDDRTLLELRDLLLDGVYPELAARFKFHADTTKPSRRNESLAEVHRYHEMSRLRAQLREAINRERRLNHSDYIGNDEILRHKAMLAQSIIENGGKRRKNIDYSVLESYADARGLSLETACALLVDSFALCRERLLNTERLKDQVMARIDAVATMNDIDDIENMIAAI